MMLCTIHHNIFIVGVTIELLVLIRGVEKLRNWACKKKSVVLSLLSQYTRNPKSIYYIINYHDQRVIIL